MSATILPFVRPDIAGRGPDAAAAEPEPPRMPVLRPHALPTSRQIAHRWAMLSHLARHYSRPEPDPARPTSPVLR
jgi:hypothetical protein